MILQSDREAWLAARVGCLSASKMGDMLARTQKGWGASRANYAAQLVCERLTGEPTESYTNAAMQWGLDKEPEARAAYEFRIDQRTAPAAWVRHPSLDWSGASPDGFVGGDGLVEFKCPNTATHIETMLGAGIPEKYRWQMQWQMACTGREWCDFVSYDPRLPENMRFYIRRFERETETVAMLEREAAVFLGEIADTIGALQKRCA